MKADLIACETTILRLIATSSLHRRDIAQTYRLILESSEAETVDFARINNAIIERWSMSGLVWIKKTAFSGKCFA